MRAGPTVSLISTVLIVLAMISMWVSFAILPDGYSCTDPDFNTACLPSCTSERLPGEAESLEPRSDAFRYELKPYYLGDRTCAWFKKDPTRCRLPTKGDICFDRVTWSDTAGKDCEVWTRYIRSARNKDTNTSYSPRELGDDPLCHTPPPHHPNMSAAELQEMRRACCVCGAHRDERNYYGSLSKKHPGSFSTATTPPQHRGKLATHLTQCCECDSRGIVPKKDGSEDNIRKRGGTWKCKKTKHGNQLDFIMGEPNVTRRNIEISAITLSVASVLSLAILLWVCTANKEADGAESTGADSGNEFFDETNARFLLRL